MLVKFDNYNDNVIYDFLAGKFVTGKETGAIGKKKKVIPFTAPISIKKLRPSTKVSKKIGDSWLSSQKLTMAYILAGYLMKTGKTRLAGFISKSDKNNIFIEITINTSSVTASYRWITDNPQDFLAMEGRGYDVIIGDPNVATELIDWNKLWKEYVKETRPLHMVIAAVIIFAMMFGVLYMTGIIGGKNRIKPVAGPPPGQQQGPPPLSSGEVRVLSVLVTQEILQAYKNYVESLEETPDIAVRTVTIQIKPGQLDVTGSMSVAYESVYPYTSSTKDGDLYSMKTEKTIVRKREDIPIATPLIDAVKDNRLKALGVMIDSGDVAAREESGWKFNVTIEKDYKATVNMLNLIYFSPVVINSLTIDENSARGEFFLHNL